MFFLSLVCFLLYRPFVSAVLHKREFNLFLFWLNWKGWMGNWFNLKLIMWLWCFRLVAKRPIRESFILKMDIFFWKNKVHTSLHFLNSSRKCNMLIFRNLHYLMKKLFYWKATLENSNTTSLLLWNLVAFATFNKG